MSKGNGLILCNVSYHRYFCNVYCHGLLKHTLVKQCSSRSRWYSLFDNSIWISPSGKILEYMLNTWKNFFLTPYSKFCEDLDYSISLKKSNSVSISCILNCWRHRKWRFNFNISLNILQWFNKTFFHFYQPTWSTKWKVTDF